jgi:hypothetical protein
LEFRPKFVGWGSILHLITAFLKHMFERVGEGLSRPGRAGGEEKAEWEETGTAPKASH